MTASHDPASALQVQAACQFDRLRTHAAPIRTRSSFVPNAGLNRSLRQSRAPSFPPHETTTAPLRTARDMSMSMSMSMSVCTRVHGSFSVSSLPGPAQFSDGTDQYDCHHYSHHDPLSRPLLCPDTPQSDGVIQRFVYMVCVRAAA